MTQDRQHGRSNTKLAFQRDRHQAGTKHLPVETRYAKLNAALAATFNIAVKAATLTVTAPSVLAPVIAGAVTTYFVDWGDGTAPNTGAGPGFTHNYATAGPKTATVRQEVKTAGGKLLAVTSLVKTATAT